jgi:predicted Zn-dependent peptidase
MSFHHHVLPNGLTLIGEVSPSARSVAVGFFVRTGSRDEAEPAVSGVSHFLEHMVFKGTPRRSALEVNRDFDAIGANYNAFTSEENTVFYGAVLPEYLPQAVDILADILRPSLRGDDFDMEKKVIIEEIGMYDDQPGWCLYDHAKKAFFDTHPLGNSVLGSVESITNLTREQMAGYFDRRYVAPNIIVSVAGNFDWPAFVGLVEKHCGVWSKGDAPRTNVFACQSNPRIQTLKKETVTQEHVLLISPAPGGDDPLRHASDVLAMILGDSTNSRLYWDLVDPGLAESADVSFHDYQGAGGFFTSYSCDPEDAEEILARIGAIFAEVQKNSVTAEELATAKSKVLSRVVRGSERPMGRMQALGMAWMYLGKYLSVDDELKAFDAVDLAAIREVLDRYPLVKPAIFALGPIAEVANSFDSGVPS